MADDVIRIVVEPDTSDFNRDLNTDLSKLNPDDVTVEVHAEVKNADGTIDKFTRDANGRLRKNGKFVVEADTRTAAKGMAGFVSNSRAQLGQLGVDARTKFQTMGRDMQAFAARASKQLAGLLVVATTAFSAIGTGAAINLNKNLREVVTLTGLTGGAADKAFAKFGDQVKTVSGEVGILQGTLTKGLYQALSAGVPQGNALDFMRVASKASIAGVTDVETAVDGLTTNINAFKIPMSDAQRVADVMFTTVKLGKTNFTELSQSMFQIAPIASAMGVSVEQASAALATLTKSGVPTSVAATQIRAALVSTAKPTEAMKAAFEQLNVSGFDQLLKRSGSMQGAFNAMAKTTGGSNTKMTEMFGSVEAVNAVLGITGKNASTASSDLAAMNKAAGATNAAFGEMEKARGFDHIKTTVANAATSFGQMLLPVLLKAGDLVGDVIGAMQPLGRVLTTVGASFAIAFGGVGEGTDVIDTLSKAMESLAVFVEQNQESIIAFALIIKDLVVSAGGLVKALVPVLFPVLKMLGVLFAGLVIGAAKILTWVMKLVTVFLQWKGAIGVIALALAAFLSWPVLVATALGLLVAVVIRNFDQIVAFFRAVPGKVWGAIKALGGILMRVFKGALNLALTAAKMILTLYIAYLRAVPLRILQAIVSLGSLLWNFITNVWNRFRQITVNLITAYINFVRSIPGKIVSAIGSVATLLYGKGKDIFNGLLDGLKAGWEAVKKWLSGIGDKIKKLKGPIEVDRTLLVDEGKAIMGGFHEGLKSKWEGVSGWLADRGGFISGLLSKVGLGKVQDAMAGLFAGEVSIGEVQGVIDRESDGGMHPSSGLADTTRMANIIAKRFGVYISSLYRPGAVTTTGNRSQHADGMAADFSNGITTPQMDALAAWAYRLVGRAFKQVLYRTMTGGNHFNHVHIGWKAREKGGSVSRGGNYMVGEAGPEPFIPRSSGFILSNARLDRMLNVDRRLGAVERGSSNVDHATGATVTQNVTINMPPITAADGQGWAMLTANRLTEMLRATAPTMAGGIA